MIQLLSGVRVVEFGILFNGDMLGMLLGDLGADVVKVEAPGRGDYLREMHGHLAPGWSPTHIQVNRNKRGVALDVHTDAGREAFFRLIEKSDVFIDGLAVGACDRLGVGYEAQRARNGMIVYCQHAGFGATGPYASLPTHGVMPAAIAGARPTAMGEDGFMHPSASCDLLGGSTSAGEAVFVGATFGAMYVAAALRWRAENGRGLHLDIATSDAALESALVGVSVGLNRDRLVDLDGMPAIEGSEWQGAKYQYYETSDGQVVLFCCMEDKFWNSFCRAVGREDLSAGASSGFDYGTDELRRELQRLFHARTLNEWMTLAVQARLPIGPAHTTITAVRRDPQVASRDIIIEGEHPAVGPFTYIGSPVRVEDQPFTVRRPAPANGEHTREVLAELGYDDKEIDAITGPQS